jgi:hypothetical protein
VLLLNECLLLLLLLLLLLFLYRLSPETIGYTLVFDQFPQYYVNILLGDFSAIVGKEDILKPTVVNESLHDISNANGGQSNKLCDVKESDSQEYSDPPSQLKTGLKILIQTGRTKSTRDLNRGINEFREGYEPGGGWEFFFSPCPDLLWCPPSLLSNGYRR